MLPFGLSKERAPVEANKPPCVTKRAPVGANKPLYITKRAPVGANNLPCMTFNLFRHVASYQ